MYISFVYKLPMVINIYYCKPEVKLWSASLENFEVLKITQWGNLVIFNLEHENNQK